jgi:hypothetical protein
MATLQAQDLVDLVTSWRARYLERDRRHTRIDEIVTDDGVLTDANGEPLDRVSPNLIQVGIEDTADAAALVPSVRVMPHRTTKQVKASAAEMERIAAHYGRISNVPLLIPQTVRDMATYGHSAWLVRPEFAVKAPVIERRDPRTCYPEPSHKPYQPVRRAVFLRRVYLSSLSPDYQAMVAPELGLRSIDSYRNQEIVFVEYFDDEVSLTAAAWGSFGAIGIGPSLQSQSRDVRVIPLEEVENPTGVCPVVVPARLTIDGEYRGQFDQAIDPQIAHHRLQALYLDYADQAVYSDIWVKNPIGEVAFGGGSYIQLGVDGQIGRVPPATSSFNVDRGLSMVEDGIHLAGRWPKSRPGEIDQSIASAKYLEASAGMMNTVIKAYHLVLQDAFERAYPLAFAIDKHFFPGRKTMSGQIENQEFLEDYSTDDIDTANLVKVDYGLGLGRDPAQAAILMLQYQGAGFVSKQFVMENIDGLTDVAKVKAQLDAEQLTDIMYGKLLQSAQAGQLSDRQLLELARRREQGDDFFALYEEFIVEPAEAVVAGSVPSGLSPGQLLVPGGTGPVPAPPGLAPPGPGPGVPPAPAPELLSRLSTPVPGAGGRSFLSSDVGGT